MEEGRDAESKEEKSAGSVGLARPQRILCGTLWRLLLCEGKWSLARSERHNEIYGREI
jgi:hypothetical protein